MALLSFTASGIPATRGSSAADRTNGPGAAAFSLDGRQLFVANASDSISVFRLDATGAASVNGPAPVPTGSNGGRPAGGLLLLTGDLDEDGLVSPATTALRFEPAPAGW